MLHASSQVPFAARRAATCQKTAKANSAKCFLKDSSVPTKRGQSNRKTDSHAAVIDEAQNGALSSSLIKNHEANNLTVNTQVNCFNLSNAHQNQGELSSNHYQPNNLQSASIELHQIQKHLQQQQKLREVEHKLRDSLNLSTIVGVAVVESAHLFDAQQAILMEYRASKQEWQQVSQYCKNQSIAWQKQCSLVKEEFPDLTRQLLNGETLRICQGQPLPTTETRQWLACQPGNWILIPISTPHFQPSPSPTGMATTAVDLKTADTHSAHPPEADAASAKTPHWGVLALALPQPLNWTTEAIACAEHLVFALSAAIAHAEQYQSLLTANAALQKLALSDGLTGLANRRRFDEHLADEWQRLARDRQPLSLILCDLDYFKHYNDTFGHPAGDRCLTKVATALRSGPQRPADLVARYGGEEFAIILPNTDTKGAWRIAQKIHNSIRSLQIPHVVDEEKPYVTVTMGVSTIIPGHDATAQILVQAADLALYHAKKQGRDRTYVHAHYNTVNVESSGHTSSGDSELDMTPPEDP